jgi:hypothetical protein
MKELQVGTKVRTRMMGVDVETVILAVSPQGHNRFLYLLEIPADLQRRVVEPFSHGERGFLQRARDDGGFNFYGTAIKAIP